MPPIGFAGFALRHWQTRRERRWTQRSRPSGASSMAKPGTAVPKARPLLTGQAKRSPKPEPADTHLELKIWLRLLNISNQIKRTLAARLRQDFDTSMARFDLLAQLERAAPQRLSMTA